MKPRSLRAPALKAARARRLAETRRRVLAELDSSENPLPARLLHRALAEAEALAWLTSAPDLFLPALAHEKLQKARQWQRRQRRVFEQSHSAIQILAE